MGLSIQSEASLPPGILVTPNVWVFFLLLCKKLRKMLEPLKITPKSTKRLGVSQYNTVLVCFLGSGDEARDVWI